MCLRHKRLEKRHSHYLTRTVSGFPFQVSVPGESDAPAEPVAYVVPDGVSPGDELSITAPSGREVTVIVPEGARPGETIEADLPATEVDDLAALLAGTASALAAPIPASRYVCIYIGVYIFIYVYIY